MQYTAPDTIEIHTIESWKGTYALLDSGCGYKLEKFGSIVTARPEPQALWPSGIPVDQWEWNLHFQRDKNQTDKGLWTRKNLPKDSWELQYSLDPTHTITFKLMPTSFKHLGLFPEQAHNWNLLFSLVREHHISQVLNLFAYTGGSSLACALAGAQVTHVDAVKLVVQWAKENAELTGVNQIRWMVDDAVKFVKREIRRSNTYGMIVLDPPAYGRGPEGEKWVFEEQFAEFVQDVFALLPQSGVSFVLVNMYSMGFSSLVAANLVRHLRLAQSQVQLGTLAMEDRFGHLLPLSDYCLIRVSR